MSLGGGGGGRQQTREVSITANISAAPPGKARSASHTSRLARAHAGGFDSAQAALIQRLQARPPLPGGSRPLQALTPQRVCKSVFQNLLALVLSVDLPVQIGLIKNIKSCRKKVQNWCRQVLGGSPPNIVQELCRTNSAQSLHIF